MNWFKHDSDATSDAKIKKLIMKYGAEGYAIYFHCVELIVSDLNENNITFELEHDAEIIADNLKIKGTQEQAGVDRVGEIMRFIVSLGLFEGNNGAITCYKILKRLDASMTSSSKMRSLLSSAKENHDKVMTQHDKVMTESCKTRLDKTRLDNTIQHPATPCASAPVKNQLVIVTKDPLYTLLWDSFLAITPRFSNYGKEGKACHALLKAIRNLSPKSPEDAAKAILERFAAKRNGNEKFWKGQPFTPSGLLPLVDRIVADLQADQGKEIDPEVLEGVRF